MANIVVGAHGKPSSTNQSRCRSVAQRDERALLSCPGPTMFARIGVMRALNRHVERVFNSSHKDTHWEKYKLGAGSVICASTS
jgi:hypothetical protein